MRAVLLSCAAASLLALAHLTAGRAAASDTHPTLQQIRIVPSGTAVHVIVAGDAATLRTSVDPRSMERCTDILSSTGERLATVSERGTNPNATALVRASDGRALAQVQSSTSPRVAPAINSEPPSSTVMWRSADGSVTTIAAFGVAPIELIAGPSAADDASTTSAIEFALLPITPNPLRGSTQVRFRLPEASRVMLELFDLSGRRVSRLLDETRTAGEHTANLRAGSLPPGRYYLRLATPGPRGAFQHAATQSIVLLK